MRDWHLHTLVAQTIQYQSARFNQGQAGRAFTCPSFGRRQTACQIAYRGEKEGEAEVRYLSIRPNQDGPLPAEQVCMYPTEPSENGKVREILQTGHLRRSKCPTFR